MSAGLYRVECPYCEEVFEGHTRESAVNQRNVHMRWNCPRAKIERARDRLEDCCEAVEQLAEEIEGDG